jgi:hypothetical protein
MSGCSARLIEEPGAPLCLVDSISRSPKPGRSLGIDGGQCVDALKIENAIARQR